MTDDKANFKILPPKLPKEIYKLDFLNNSIQNEACFSSGVICDCSIKNQLAEHVTLKQIIFRNVIFEHVSFKFLDLMDIRFENCDLSNVDLSGAVIHRTEIINWALELKI